MIVVVVWLFSRWALSCSLESSCLTQRAAYKLLVTSQIWNFNQNSASKASNFAPVTQNQLPTFALPLSATLARDKIRINPSGINSGKGKPGQRSASAELRAFHSIGNKLRNEAANK